MSLQQIQNLKPFHRFCMTIGVLPTAFNESMTYFECLQWLSNYLENVVIPAVNNNAEALTELQNLFLELQNYVNNYFENLDVQEEINNKLDEMVISGELQQIISQKDYYKFPKLNIHRLARWILDNGNNNINYETSPYYANTQGSCLIDRNTIAICYTPSNDYTTLGRAKIRVYSLGTGTLLRENVLPLEHANGMIYKDGKLYVTGCFSRDENNNYIYSKNVYVVNAETLELENTIVIDPTRKSIVYC